MQAFMKRHRLWAPAVFLLLALGMALYAQFSLAAIPAHYQYLWPAPAPVAATQPASGTDEAATGDDGAAASENTGMRTARLGMETLEEQLSGACEATALYAVADGASVIADMDGATAATARLEAISEGSFALRPQLLTSGRLLYDEEMQRGERVAMLDEKLAVALFNYAEPIDRYVLLDNQRYRVVGIVNDSRRVGDHWEYAFYVPYRAVEKSALTMTALCIETRPIPGAGGWAAFEAAAKSISPLGTCLSLPKETMNAALPLRAVGCLFGFLFLLVCLRALNVRVVLAYREYRRLLREQYAMRLFPRFAWRAALLGVGYAVCAAALAGLFMTLVEPVYTFPEWIPAVLVEPKDVSTAFWNVWQGQAAVVEWRSPELLRARFFREVMAWACGGLALTGALIAARLGETVRQWTAAPEPEAAITEKEPIGTGPSLE